MTKVEYYFPKEWSATKAFKEANYFCKSICPSLGVKTEGFEIFYEKKLVIVDQKS